AFQVYTINLESRYLLVQGVPALGVMRELVEQFALYGAIEEYHALDEYPAEPFTEVYLIKFQKVQCARVAKKKMDERSFFGSLLHVCYAPEFETVQETREKLQDRRKYIAKATNQRDHFLAKRAEGPKRIISANSEYDGQQTSSEFPGAGNWNPAPCFPDSHLVPQNNRYLSGNGNQSQFMLPQNASNCAETSGCFGQTQNVQAGCFLPVPSAQHRTAPLDNGIDRFLPRTTHLQERKRRREESNRSALLGTYMDSMEVPFGPQLPAVPKVDMDDDSLNTSAALIRSKLKQVADSVSRTSVEEPQDSTAKPLVKQRRRI
ncbi:RBM48 protein, partial [Crypturellus undulatus]|nr:RBM48 protein [Crypturellus undulatus]